MENSKIKIAKFFALITVLTLLNCAPSSKSLTIASGQIPEKFQGYDKTLLIAQNNKAWTKIAKKHFKNNYKGKYFFTTEEELNLKYSDLNEFRFIVSKNNYIFTGTTTGGVSTTLAATEDMYMKDRLTGKIYKTKISTSFFGILINRYSIALERIRTE